MTKHSAIPTLDADMVPTHRVEVCPCCDRCQFRIFERYTHLDVTLTYKICRYCGLVFMDPRFSQTDLEVFYRAAYRRLYSGNEQPTEFDLTQQQDRAEHLAQIVEQHVGSVQSHIDIGCSAGVLLRSVHTRNPNAKSVGIEPSDEHRAHCLSQGVSAFASLEAFQREARGRFQLVTLSHVLEHLSEPVAYLEMLRTQILDADGYLLVEVPNLFGHVSYEVAHLYCFWTKTLADVCRRAGFRIHFAKVHSITRHDETRQHYLTVVARPDPDAAAIQVRSCWWRTVQLRRFKGLSGRSWHQLILRAVASPHKAFLLTRRVLLRS